MGPWGEHRPGHQFTQRTQFTTQFTTQFPSLVPAKRRFTGIVPKGHGLCLASQGRRTARCTLPAPDVGRRAPRVALPYCAPLLPLYPPLSHPSLLCTQVLHDLRHFNAIMNRFLSRREKHPGKRSSKNNPPKVRTPPPSPSSQLQLPTVDGSEPVRSLRRRADSLQTLYHKLPSILPYYGGENAFFVRQKPHCPHLLPFHAESSTTQSSVYVQARSQSASSDHHAIFSKDAPKSADKDDEKKVRSLTG